MASIKDIVDEIGKVRAEKKKLDARDKELKVILMKHINTKRLKATDIIAGNKFKVTVKAKTDSFINPKKVYKLLADKDFFKVINVVKKRLQEILSAEEIDKCSTFKDAGLDFQVGKENY